MNLESKYYDPIRARQPRGRQTQAPPAEHACDWEGCFNDAPHRAPVKAKELSGQGPRYRWFCGEHIAPYNQAFNFFEDMSDKDAIKWEQDALTGHRPTWKRHGAFGKGGASWAEQTRATEDAARAAHDAERAHEPARPRLSAGQRRALQCLGLEETADAASLSRRYKQLLKRYHPDMNNGERRFEAALTRTLQAYHYLKASGFGGAKTRGGRRA